MNNIIVSVSKKTRMVNVSKSFLGNDGENLQEKLVFKFDDEFVNGTARLEYILNGESAYAMLTKEDETYTIPVKSVITKEGHIDMQLVVTEGTSTTDIPIFKSNMFYVYFNGSINADEEEQPEGYTGWLEIANTKLNTIDEAITKTNNLNVTASKSGTTTTISVTNKNGVTTTTQVLDGVKGDKGDKGDTGNTGPQGIKGDKGEKGDQGIQGVKGDKGDKGEKGDTGAAFTYDMFTPEQLAALKGPQGQQGEQGPQGEQGIQGEQGPQGDSYTITQSDYNAIAEIVLDDIDATEEEY